MKIYRNLDYVHHFAFIFTFFVLSLIPIVNIFPDTKANPAGIKTISLQLDFISGSSRKAGKTAIHSLYYAVESLFNRKYYPYVQIKKAEKTDCSFKVVVLENKNSITITTSESSSSLKISSTLSAVIPSPLVSVIAGDVFYLFAESEKFKFINFSVPPRISLSLNTDSLGGITGWKQNQLLPLDITPSNKGLLITLEGGFLTLGNSLELKYNTLIDILYQKKHPMSLPPLTAASDLLGNITVLSQNADSVNLISSDRTRNSVETLKLKQTDNFLFTGLYTGGFAILDETVDSQKTILYYKTHRRNRTPNQLQNQPQKQTYLQSLTGYPLKSAFISAVTSDYDGNLWLYDSLEKRIRIIGKRGREIGSIKPVIQPGILMFPQVLAVYQDGSFLIGSSGILVCFDTEGIPLWKLKTYRINGIHSIPAFYRVACSEQDASFFLLDIQSHRILKFQENLPAENRANVSSDSILYSIKTLKLKPVEFKKIKQEKLAHFNKRAGAYYEKQLDYAQAEEFYNQSLAAYREIRRKDPVDENAFKQIAKLIAARNRVRGKSPARSSISVSLLNRTFFSSYANLKDSGNTVIFNITNLTDNRINDIKVRMNIPGFSKEVSESTISQLPPYRSRKIDAPLLLKTNTAGLKTDMEARLNFVIDYTTRNEPGKMQVFFPVYFKNRNFVKIDTGSIREFTQFYMPENRVILEFTSTITHYYQEFLHSRGAEPEGTTLMSVIETLLERETKKGNNGLKPNKIITYRDSLYIEDPPLFPLYYVCPAIDTNISPSAAVNTGLPDEAKRLSALIFIASVSESLGFTPSLLYRKGETILLVETGISMDNLDKSSGFFNELKALAVYPIGEDENRNKTIIIPVYSTSIEKPAGRSRIEDSPESRTTLSCFPLTGRTVTTLLEHIHKIGIESFKRFKFIENPVPSVYHGVNGENYIPIFSQFNPVCISRKHGEYTYLHVLFIDIGIDKKFGIK